MTSEMSDELYSKRLCVHVKSNDRDDRRVYINIKMELHHITAPVHRKELVVRLTDEQDLFFLYTLRLGEEDFQSLKMQQGLLVDFGAFPQKFIDLLNMCTSEEHKEVPKFVLHLISQNTAGLDKTVSILNVIETNPFKHLTHLSLKFLPGTDTDVKKYLADCLKQIKDCNSLLQERFEHTESDLSQRLKHSQQLLSTATKELDILKSEWQSRITEQTAKQSQDMSREKERSIQAQASHQQRYEREKRELEQAHMNIVKQTEGRLHELENSNKDLTDKRYKSEATIRELKSKVNSLEEENFRSKQEIQSLRKQTSSLDADYHEQEKLANQLRMRTAVLEQEVKDKEQVISKSTDLLGSEQGQKKKYECDLESKQKEFVRVQNKMKAMAEELKKGNEIIKKLQTEIKNYHAKIKVRNQIATEQEKLISEKDQELERLRQDLASTKDDLKQKLEENAKLSESLENTLQKLEESRQLLKTNENVIQWLNKQITDTQLSHRHIPANMDTSNASSMSHRSAPAALHNYNNNNSNNNYVPGRPYSAEPHFIPSRGYASSQPTGAHPSHPIQHHHAPINPHRHPPQVQYNPGNPRKSALPVASGVTGTKTPTIPEEIHPHSTSSSSANTTGSTDKENDPSPAPLIDPKYLQRREDVISVRGLGMNNHQTSSPSIVPSHSHNVAGTILQNPNRISQQTILHKVPYSRPNQPPLASAYFPSQPKPS